MKIVFNVKEDDARNPGVIADCVHVSKGGSQPRRSWPLRNTCTHNRKEPPPWKTAPPP